MFAIVRNRRGVIAAVEPADEARLGRLHLVHVEYKDDQLPHEERLLWELEPRGRLLEPNALPDPASDPMPAADFDALVRAARWTSATPFLDPDGHGPLERLPISSPFHGAVQVEDFQLVPLLKALAMPRVNLLIADDVGLGKTIEAGLILSELLIRRRIQRVLILTPASLRAQWRDEMWEKFALAFDVVDREETFALRRRMGIDANPWRAFNRIIASYHYLRQDDVLEQFLAASNPPEGAAHLPWDLLIVDECHNLMPSPFGEDSDLCRMLRLIAPRFEHRLFLSATPHNGHTRSFSGLLEILDPVRFTQTSELKPAERARVQQVVLRRLKRDINERTSPPRFCRRLPPEPVVLSLSAEEIALTAAFDAFRRAIRRLIAGSGLRRRAGTFAVEILGKRLLSCPVAFAESWRRCKEGLAEASAATESDVESARRAVEREIGDDPETQAREATAANVVGAWLKHIASDLQGEIGGIDAALTTLGLNGPANPVEVDPARDARFDALVALVERLLRANGSWRDDERLIVFTEYKTTLDYLARRLRAAYGEERVLTLFGSGGAAGMDRDDRREVIAAFNDPRHTVRVLVATDAAAEGLNLQSTARYLLHYDCPWNPSRLEQRNGRLDRHGQARDVAVHYFVTDQDQDLAFLAHVVRKANEIRDDLGSANELFDEAAHRRLVDGDSAAAVQADLDRRLADVRRTAAFEADATAGTMDLGVAAEQRLRALEAELDLGPASLRETLEAALAIRAGRPQLECGADLTCKLLNPGLPGWRDVVDESLRRQGSRGAAGSLCRLAFQIDPFLEAVGERLVFRPRPDVLLMHLSHPMLQRALSVLTRRRFPGTGEEVSRWTIRLGGVPEGADALVLLTVEEIAVNELRETFHHWVRTVAFPVRNGRPEEPIAHVPAAMLGASAAPAPAAGRHLERARTVFEDVEADLKAWLHRHASSLTAVLEEQLRVEGTRARQLEEERYRSRQGEVSALIAETTIAKLEREIDELKARRQQGLLFEEAEALDRLDRSIEEKQKEIERRTRHYDEIRAQLERERERILKYLLPRRHAMSGHAQVFPVAVEIRLPAEGAAV
jgi:superfamily II DNA or RNA helicase